MPIKRIIFVRPGETDWNRVGRQQGWVAIPLNQHGKLQVQRLAHFIRNIGLGMLYTSDLRRAVQTAELLAETTHLHPIFDPRLRERNVGVWQGLTLDEIKAWYPDEFQRFRENPWGYQIPGGESRRQVVDRALAAFGDILARGNAETVGVVTHSIATRLMLSRLIPDCDPDTIELSNISVTTIARDHEDLDHWQLVQVNDVSHLEGLPTHIVKEPGDR